MAYTLIRIFSLFIFGNYVLQYFTFLIVMLFQLLEPSGLDVFGLNAILTNVFLLLFWLVVSGLLWFKAEHYAKYFQSTISLGSDSNLNNEEKFEFFLKASIIILGLYFIIPSVSQIASEFIVMNSMKNLYSPEQIDIRLKQLFNPGFKFLFGLLCVMNAKGVIWCIKKLKGM